MGLFVFAIVAVVSLNSAYSSGQGSRALMEVPSSEGTGLSIDTLKKMEEINKSKTGEM